MTDQKQKDLGIFYTPKIVVDFIFQMLMVMKNKEDRKLKRWQSHQPPHYPSVIDPACGEGIFLKIAVDSGFTKPAYIWGVDLDENAKNKWEEITLLKSFGSKAKLDLHFYHQDGLLPLPERKTRHKKGGIDQHDAVVGNPPYGGIGISEITKELEKALFDYQIWGLKFQKNQRNSPGNVGLFETSIPEQFKEKIKNFPIEILFLDRFIQLAKAGGWIAIIIPDGILANSTYHYARQYLAQKTKVTGIISLPRETFKLAGTNAKTSILILEKREMTDYNYPVFLASTENLNKDNFDTIITKFREFYD